MNPSQSSVENPVPTSDAAAKALIPKLTVEDVVCWSGWDSGKTGTGSGEVLVEWAKSLSAEGGGDYPEAAKSALKFLLELVAPSHTTKDNEDKMIEVDEPDKIRDTIVLWYTDSPPHHRSQRGVNRLLEIAAHKPPPNSKFASSSLFTKDTLKSALNLPTPHPDLSDLQKTSHNHGKSCTDWVHLCLAAEEARLRVYTILPQSTSDVDATFWVMLGEMTQGGTCAIGGSRTSDAESVRGQKDALAGYIIGGGDFVRAVMRVSLAVVLDALRGNQAVGESGVKESDADIEDDSSKNDSKIEDGDSPLDLSQFRWLTYKAPDIRQYLPGGLQSATGQSNAEPYSNSSSATPSTLDTEGAKETRDDDAHIMKDEEEGSQGFLPPPWRGSHLGGTVAPVRGIRRVETVESSLGTRLARALALSPGSLERSTLDIRRDQTYWDDVMDGLKGVVNADVESVLTIPMFAEMWKSGEYTSHQSS